MYHRKTGGKAVLQVKSGSAGIDLAAPADIPARVFVVAADGRAYGLAPPNVTQITRAQLLQFAQKHRELLPEHIRH